MKQIAITIGAILGFILTITGLKKVYTKTFGKKTPKLTKTWESIKETFPDTASDLSPTG